MLQNAHKSFKQQLTRHLNKLNYDQRKRKNAYKNFDQNVKNIHQYIVDNVIYEPLNFKASMKRGLTMFWLSGGSLCENNKDLGIEVLRTTTLDQAALNLLDNPRLVSVHHDEYQVSKHIWDSLLTFHESFVAKHGLYSNLSCEECIASYTWICRYLMIQNTFIIQIIFNNQLNRILHHHQIVLHELIAIALWFRYIDDITEAFEINKRYITAADLILIKAILINDRGLIYREMQSRIIIKNAVSWNTVSLDLIIHLNPITYAISSEVFRSAISNDDFMMHLRFRSDIINKLRERGYNEGKIIRIVKSCKIQWKHRNKYLQSIRTNYNMKSLRLMADHQHHMEFQGQIAIYPWDEWMEIVRQLKELEDDTKRIYYKKTFNLVFNYDKDFRTTLCQLVNELGVPEDEMTFMLSNKVGYKLGFLLFR
eukprot:85648_1